MKPDNIVLKSKLQALIGCFREKDIHLLPSGNA